MEVIRIIRNKAELEGTAYIELLPGRYNKQCWNEGSLFFEEDVFGYLEAIISRHVPSYDHYAFTEISANRWAAIVRDFQSLALALDQSKSVGELTEDVGFLFLGAEARFAEDFSGNKVALRNLLREVSSWVSREAALHECITVLGL